jgi:hypothetical protein
VFAPSKEKNRAMQSRSPGGAQAMIVVQASGTRSVFSCAVSKSTLHTILEDS